MSEREQNVELLHVALVEATTLWGKELRHLLEASRLPLAEPVFLGTEEQKGTLAEYADAPVLVGPVDEQSFVGVDLAFFCGRSDLLAHHLHVLREVVCVDLGGSLDPAGDEGHLIVAGVNPVPADLRLLINPHPSTSLLATVLAALEPLGPARSDAVVLLPAADAGEAGIEELQRQAVALLNFTPPPREVFGGQLAFNLIPTARQQAARERRVAVELARVLGSRLPSPELTLVWAPTFMGVAAVLHVELDSGADQAAVHEALEASPRLHVIGEDQGCGPAELPDDGSDRLAVTCLGGPPGRQRLWCVTDHLRRGSIMNALEILETVFGVGPPEQG